MRRWGVLFFAALLAGCAPLSTTANAPLSYWGRVITIAQAEQTSAPALSVADDRIAAAWIGADERGIHQDARLLSANALSDPVVLPLPPAHPFEQQMHPAADDQHHLLWLDALETSENRLYAALLSPELRVTRGPTPVSDRETRRYSALPGGDGELLIVWSGGLLAEPALYLQTVDRAGRPRPPVALVTDADWPALIRASDGSLHLFWLRLSDGQLHHATLHNEQLLNTQALAHHAALEAGDRLHSLNAALDNSHFYLFWNVTRAAGGQESWMTTRAFGGSMWSVPVRLGITRIVNAEETGYYQTNFNSGTTLATYSGEGWLSWVAPLRGQFDNLPVAAQFGDEIAVVYFHGGQAQGYQTIAPAQLIGTPTLHVDQARYLYLAWAQPQPAGAADLQVASLRFGSPP